MTLGGWHTPKGAGRQLNRSSNRARIQSYGNWAESSHIRISQVRASALSSAACVSSIRWQSAGRGGIPPLLASVLGPLALSPDLRNFMNH